ncbi:MULTISPECIES: hypothetical protein [unclassified Methylobacterium]|nr:MULTISPECIES: hypothetical protein [unclassified Methylobacterium]
MKAEAREATSLEVQSEIETERQEIEERTERLKALRLARENAGS